MQQFYGLVTPKLKERETKTAKKGTNEQTQQLSCTSQKTTIKNSTKTEQK